MNTERAIQAHVDALVRDLTAMIRESALQTVQQALGGPVARKRGPGRPRGTRKAKAKKRRAKRKRIRRSSEDVEALASRILGHVKANPGQGVTEIARALRRTSKDLKLPIQKLLAEKKLKTKGERRGTKYFAGGRGGGTRKRKATKKKRAARKKTAKKRVAKKTRRKTAKKKATRKAKGRKKKTATRKAAKKPRARRKMTKSKGRKKSTKAVGSKTTKPAAEAQTASDAA